METYVSQWLGGHVLPRARRVCGVVKDFVGECISVRKPGDYASWYPLLGWVRWLVIACWWCLLCILMVGTRSSDAWTRPHTEES